MALQLKRTGAPCRVKFTTNTDVPGIEVPTDGVLEVPEKYAQSFLGSDGTPDAGWELYVPEPPPADLHIESADITISTPFDPPQED
jgi:hypothetical protein